MADQLSTRIRSARNTAEMSREQLAGSLGVSLSTIVRYETGRTERISIHTMQAIAKATGQPLSYFLETAA